MTTIMSLVGMMMLLGVAFAFSTNRSAKISAPLALHFYCKSLLVALYSLLKRAKMP